MRAFVAALAALLIATASFAGNTLKYDPTLNEDGSQKADSLAPLQRGYSYSTRVAIVYDSPGQADVFNQNSLRTTRLEMERAFSGLVNKLRSQGCQVDFYSTAFFRTRANQSNFLWYRMGSYYPVTICVGFANDASAVAKAFYSADSTTTHLIHLASSGVGLATNRFSQTFGVDSLHNINTTSGISGQMVAAVRTYQNGDTLFFPTMGVGGRNVALPSGVSSVVRLLHPIVLSSGPKAFTLTSDTSNYSLPTSVDSVAGPHEWLGPAWRVYFTASGRSVDYIKASSASAFQYNFALVAYSIAARYLNVKPIKIAMEIDDVTDVSVGQNRGSNAMWDSLYIEFRDTWKYKPTFSFNPLHAVEYIKGVNPSWEDAWTQGPGWSWINKYSIPWVHHAHDSTAASPTSGLLGRFGGYPNNGSLFDSTFANGTRMSFHRVYAFRFNPGASDNEKRWGIYNKLAYSDSLRKAHCPSCPLPPYLSFPGNFSLAGNWRSRTLANNPSWGLPPNSRTGQMGPSGRGYRSLGDCPPDSMFLAMARGLKVPNGGTLYLRAVEMQGTSPASRTAFRPYGDNAILTTSMGADSDSLIAHSFFTIPDQEHWVRDESTGYAFKVKAIGFSSIELGGVAGNRSGTFPRLALVSGFWNPVQIGRGVGTLDASGKTWLNENFAVDPNGVYNPSQFNQRNYNESQHSRMLYFHTRSIPNTKGPNSSYQLEMVRRGILQTVRAINALAGKQIIKWVYPWEMYE